MRLVQVSDCHLHADPYARSRAGYPLRQFERVLEAIVAERPDLVLVTGDISQDETAASYELALGALARLTCPWFWLSGNHDQPQLMAAVRELHDEIDLGDWRLLMLETRVSGHAHGELGPERLGRLAEHLEEDMRPTLLAMHHPPLPVGSDWLDTIGLADREAFWEVLAPHTHVRAILCGHVHQAFAGSRGEVKVYGCPSTTDQFLPGAVDFAIDEASRPGYRVMELGRDGWVTWVERVDP